MEFGYFLGIMILGYLAGALSGAFLLKMGKGPSLADHDVELVNLRTRIYEKEKLVAEARVALESSQAEYRRLYEEWQAETVRRGAAEAQAARVPQMEEVLRDKDRGLALLTSELDEMRAYARAKEQEAQDALGIVGPAQEEPPIDLHHLVALTDLSDHTEFDGAGGCRIELPAGGRLNLDTAAPAAEWNAARRTTDAVERLARLDAHTTALRGYMAAIPPAPAGQLTVAVLPGGNYLGAALARDPQLLADSLRLNVLLTPSPALAPVLKLASTAWMARPEPVRGEAVHRATQALAGKIPALAVQLDGLRKVLDHVHENEARPAAAEGAPGPVMARTVSLLDENS